MMVRKSFPYFNYHQKQTRESGSFFVPCVGTSVTKQAVLGTFVPKGVEEKK